MSKPSSSSIPSAAATPSAATSSRPVPGPPSFYHILLGLSVMTLGTIFFWSISRSLAVHRLSTTLYENTAFNRAGHLDSSPDQCRLLTCVYPIQCNPDEQLSSLLNRFEAQVRRLEELAPQFPPSMVGKDSSIPRKDTSQTDEEVLIAVSVFLVFLIEIVGLVLLHDALDRISQQHSSRALAFGVVGANMGAIWAMSGFVTWLLDGGEIMWDHVTLLCLVGLDVGCILGGVLAFGETTA